MLARIVALVSTVLMVVFGVIAADLMDRDQFMVAMYTPCVTEDSDNCYWDAQTSGNGQGRSFVVLDGVVHYLTK